MLSLSSRQRSACAAAAGNKRSLFCDYVSMNQSDRMFTTQLTFLLRSRGHWSAAVITFLNTAFSKTYQHIHVRSVNWCCDLNDFVYFFYCVIVRVKIPHFFTFFSHTFSQLKTILHHASEALLRNMWFTSYYMVKELSHIEKRKNWRCIRVMSEFGNFLKC